MLDVTAAQLLTITSTAVAVFAAMLSRRRPLLRPVAVALAATVAIDVARLALDVALRDAATPYHGAARMLFTADVVLFCAWPAPLAALAWHVLPRRRWWPPLVIFGVWGVLLAMAYPTLHGPAMVTAQGFTRPLALLLAAESLLSMRPRLPAPLAMAAVLRARTGALVVAAFATDMLGQTMGPWLRRWPQLPAWDASIAVTAMSQVLIACALAWEWGRRRTVL